MADLIYDGMTKVSWVAAIPNIAAPSAATVTSGTTLEALITPDGLSITADTAEVDNSSLASTFTTAAAGRRSFSIAVTFKVTDAAGGGLAYSTLVYLASGFLVVRRNLAVATAFAAAQVVEVYPVQCGQPSRAVPAPNEVQKCTVPMMLTADANTNATMAA